jgi:hypothetical protein
MFQTTNQFILYTHPDIFDVSKPRHAASCRVMPPVALVASRLTRLTHLVAMRLFFSTSVMRRHKSCPGVGQTAVWDGNLEPNTAKSLEFGAKTHGFLEMFPETNPLKNMSVFHGILMVFFRPNNMVSQKEQMETLWKRWECLPVYQRYGSTLGFCLF